MRTEKLSLKRPREAHLTGAFPHVGEASVREIKAIDEDIDVERHILEYDVRGGIHSHDADATRARIDRLLDERNDVASAGKPEAVGA